MRVNLNEFLTDEDISTLWSIAGRIIDSGAIIDDQDYEISLSLLKDDSNGYYDSLSEGKDQSQPVEKVSQVHMRRDLDLL